MRQRQRGSVPLGAIQAQDEALAGRVSNLYQQARDTSGRSAALDAAAFNADGQSDA